MWRFWSRLTARVSLFYQLKQWPYLRHITGTTTTTDKTTKDCVLTFAMFSHFLVPLHFLFSYLGSHLKCYPLFFPTSQFSSSFLITLQPFLHIISLVSGLQLWSVFILLNPESRWCSCLPGWRMSSLKSKWMNYKPAVPLRTMLSLTCFSAVPF